MAPGNWIMEAWNRDCEDTQSEVDAGTHQHQGLGSMTSQGQHTQTVRTQSKANKDAVTSQAGVIPEEQEKRSQEAD